MDVCRFKPPNKIMKRKVQVSNVYLYVNSIHDIKIHIKSLYYLKKNYLDLLFKAEDSVSIQDRIKSYRINIIIFSDYAIYTLPIPE